MLWISHDVLCVWRWTLETKAAIKYAHRDSRLVDRSVVARRECVAGGVGPASGGGRGLRWRIVRVIESHRREMSPGRSDLIPISMPCSWTAEDSGDGRG